MHALTLDRPIELRPSQFCLSTGKRALLRWKSCSWVEVLVSNILASSVGGALPFDRKWFVVKFRKLRACFRKALRNLYDIRSTSPITLYTYIGGCAGELLGGGVTCFRKIGTGEGARGEIRGRAVCLNELEERLRTAMRCTSVVIAHRHSVVLQGLTNILGATSAFKVVASCSDGTNCI